MTSNWMIYGANGYCAQLAVEKAVTQGRRPILAGRNAALLLVNLLRRVFWYSCSRGESCRLPR